MAWAAPRLAGEEERQTKDGQEEPKAFGDNSGGGRCRYKETGHARPAVSMQPQFTQRVAERDPGELNDEAVLEALSSAATM